MEFEQQQVVSDNCVALLKRVIGEHGVKRVVEFGCGKSTLAMDSFGVWVDAYETRKEYGQFVIKQGLLHSFLIDWDGLEVPLKSEYDMAFIDGPHGDINRGGAFASVFAIKPKIIVIHDINSLFVKTLTFKYFNADYQVLFILKEFDGSDTVVLEKTAVKVNEVSTVFKIAIAVPVADTVKPLMYFNHCHCFGEWSQKYNTIFVGVDGHKITAARNLLTDQAIGNGASHILFIDIDHALSPTLLPLLLKNAGSAMVSGLICKRGYPYEQVAFRFDHDRQLQPVEFKPGTGVYDVDACAMGCTLINLHQLKLLPKPYFTDGHFRHDINLCMKFKYELGADIKVNSDAEVGHECKSSIVYPSTAKQLIQHHLELDATQVKL